ARRTMRHRAIGGAAFRRRHLPFIGGGLDQHHAGGGAAFTDILMRLADRTAATRIVIAPGALALHVIHRRRIFGDDLRPVSLQLLCDELREAGLRPLPHFRAHYADRHGVVGPDCNPDAELVRTESLAETLGGPGLSQRGPAERKVEAERHAAG